MPFDPGSRYITAALIEDGYQVTADDIVYQCRVSQEAYANDTVWFGGGAGVSFFASLAAYGAVGSLTAAVAIPALALVGCSIAAWQVSERADHRETEARLFRKYPQLAQEITKAIEAGANTDDLSRGVSNAIATASRDGSRSMPALSMDARASESWDGDNNAFNDPIVPEIVGADEDTENGGAEGAPRTESAALAQTEIQPIAAASPSMSVVNGVETIATSKVVEPDYLARIYQIIDRNNNFFIGGQPGSGKGVMVSNLLRRKLDQYPGSIAVYIDPKGSPREDGNFRDARITRLKISGVGMSRAEYSIEVAEMLETARGFVDQCDIENGKHVWIVFDEIMNMKQKLSKDLFGEVQDLLVDCVSMGDDQGLHVIALTQSFNAGDTVGSDELLKNLALIACFKEDDFPRAKKLVQYGKTNYDSYSTEEFSRLIRKSPRKRVICIGGGFIPAPEMPLLSGWDRDKGAKVSAPSTQATFQTVAVQYDPAPDDFSDLPDLFKMVAQMAITTQTASERSGILNDLNKARELTASDPLAARERLSKYNA